MNLSATHLMAREQNSVGNPVVRRAYGTYGGEADQGEVRGTSTPPNDPAQMTSAGTLGTQPHPFGYIQADDGTPTSTSITTAHAGMTQTSVPSCKPTR